MFSNLFFLILHQPLINALIFLYNTVAFQDLGLAIIFLTILIRLILFPLFHKSARAQTIMQKLQPRIKEIQAKHKEDRVKQTEEMMALYKEHGTNPFSGILFLLVQIPVLIALYHIFLSGLSPESFSPALYSFIGTPENFDTSLLGLINLGSQSILMVILAAVAQFLQAKLSLPKRTSTTGPASPQERISRNMMYLGPIITIVIFYRFPSAVVLYWLVSSVFSVGQQIVINKDLNNNGKLGNISKGTG